ncbi:MAG: bacitracin resistance protein BacA [Proteobacteria bacterium]|nr:MAG: bacitracin resistance protein BacA [Pseudomonadota bacterium]
MEGDVIVTQDVFVYDIMGEENIKAMLRDFYRLLGTSQISAMFPKDLDTASEKSALFFIGLMGGPPIYHQTYGPPRMRARHIPFRITDEFRKEWLRCFLRHLRARNRDESRRTTLT